MHRALALIASMLIGLTVSAPAPDAATIPPAVRGARTVYLRVDPGLLNITVLKRDLNIYENEDPLTVVLFDPLGNEVFTRVIPDDGSALKSGMAEDYQRLEESVRCKLAGTYRLAVRGSSDAVWGVETTAPGMVIEGEMFFSHGDTGGSVFFPAPSTEFTITVSALHDPGQQTVPLFDADGAPLGEFALTKTGEEHTLEFPAEERQGLWRLDFEALDVKLAVTGVTVWATDPDAWFDARKSKWMLMPYRYTRYLQPGESAEIEFRLRNSTGAADQLRLEATPDEGLEAEIVSPEMPVALNDQATAPVVVRVRLAEDAPPEGTELHVFLQASAANEPSAVASSGINVRVGESPVSQPLDMPVVLRPFEHENVQFGYDPDYMRNEVHFDLNNEPWIRQRTDSQYGTTGVYTLDGGEWVYRDFIEAIRAKYPDYSTSYGGGGFVGAKLVFDGQGGIYTTLRLVAGAARPAVLLFSPDEGRSWEVHELGPGVADLEQFTGHNALQSPPPVLRYETTGPHPATFCSYNDLWLYMPTREGGRLALEEPIKVAEAVIGMCQHSGGPASSVTRDGRTHIVWGEVSGNPDGTGADERGVPTYVATYDHATRTVSEKVLLGYGPPVNDVHNVPAITMDSEGTLHVLIGAHGNNFHYVRSLRPNDSSAWAEAEPILLKGYHTEEGDRGLQTYISLVCDADDTLHTAFRQWRNDPQWHDGQQFAALSIQHRPKGGEWSEEATPLVVGAVPGYSIWYHKLTVDRLGDLWLSYAYLTSDESYQAMFPNVYNHPATLVSRDGGATWKLAETADFVAGVEMFDAR